MLRPCPRDDVFSLRARATSVNRSKGNGLHKGEIMNRNRLLGVAVIVLAGALPWVLGQDTRPTTRAAAPANAEKAQRDMKNGNYKDAYEAFSQLCLEPSTDAKKVGGFLAQAVQCLHNLNRTDEIDAFREKVIALHAGNWRLLFAAAQSYNQDQHNGYIVAGKYYRGYHRGGGKWVSSYERDRVRALQLMEQASAKTAGEEAKAEVGRFYFEFAAMLLGNRGYNEAWRLQYLTDLATLPDYDEGNYYGGNRGAPVSEDGAPVYHKLPKSWKDASSDGERWRWCLMQAAEWDSSQAMDAKYVFAQFLQNQFGVATMAEYGWFFGRGSEADDDTKKNESGPLRGAHAHRRGDHRQARHRHQAVQAPRRVQLPQDLPRGRGRKEEPGGRLADADRPRVRESPPVPHRRRDVEAVDQGVRRRQPEVEREGTRPDRGQLGPVRADPHPAVRAGRRRSISASATARRSTSRPTRSTRRSSWTT